jgi:hypothetical protein
MRSQAHARRGGGSGFTRGYAIDLLFWFVLPVANFIFFFYIGQYHGSLLCDSDGIAVSPVTLLHKVPTNEQLQQQLFLQKQQEEQVRIGMDEPCPEGMIRRPLINCNQRLDPSRSEPFVTVVGTAKHDKYRAERLAPMHYPNRMGTVIMKSKEKENCKKIVHHYVSRDKDTCFALARVGETLPPGKTSDGNSAEASNRASQATRASFKISRFDVDIDEAGYSMTFKDSEAEKQRKADKNLQWHGGNIHNIGRTRPCGFFRKVPKTRGRERILQKMKPLLQNFEEITDDLKRKVASRGLLAGDDVVILVVNEGEIDLYLNLACSCKQHNIPLNNFLIFAGSEGIVSMIEATGAMALYHKGYSHVSTDASQDYLDRVFVDMMWYKAFSVYLVLRMRMNILFQDADLVWFKDPFPYFHNYLNSTREKSLKSGSFVEAFFADDGQRSLRYAPFYANSGFYYLVASPRSEYFTWTIMTAFDAVQVLGSHQNVFTTRLVEGLALSHRNAKLLPMPDFPTGYQFHHEPRYMKKLYDKEVEPYNFHMCWTQGKPDKLVYLRRAKMWYLTEQCSPLEELIPKGRVYESLKWRSVDGFAWSSLAETCCTSMSGAP